MVFTEEAPVDSFVEDSNLSQTVQAQFNGMFPHILGEYRLSPKIRFLVQRHTPRIYALIAVSLFFLFNPASVIFYPYMLVFHAVSLLHQFTPHI